MPPKLLCPHCRLAAVLKNVQAGNTATCPFCDGAFQVPQVPSMPRTDGPPSHAVEVPFFIPPPVAVTGTVDDLAPPPGAAMPSVPPPIPQVRVVQEDEDYDPVAARRRRDPRRHDSDHHREEATLEPMSRKEANQWQTVQTGLALLQFGYLMTLLSALALVVLIGPFQPSSAPGLGPTSSSRGIEPLLCGAGGCLMIGLVLLVVGQAMLCAAADAGARSAAIGSLALLLLGSLLAALGIFLANTRVAPVAGSRAALSMYDVLELLVAVVLAISHIVFIVFLQTVVRYFRDASAKRQSTYYLAFFLVYLAVSAVTAAVAYSQRTAVPSYSSRSGELSALAALCWGCFGIFLLIALISIVQQARSVLRDRLQFGRRRRAEQRDFSSR